MAWYHIAEYQALWQILDEMNMPECQRCRSFQADFESQERQHDMDEVGWREVLAEKDRLIERQAERIETLERHAQSDQLTKQQAQQRVQELTEDKQRAARVQCNADYLS